MNVINFDGLAYWTKYEISVSISKCKLEVRGLLRYLNSISDRIVQIDGYNKPRRTMHCLIYVLKC